MATVILCLMAVWDMDTVMEATATVTSPNTDTTITDIHTEDTDIHTEDMGIHTMILTATMTIRSHPEKAPASRYYKVQQLQGVYNLQEPHFWTLCTDVYIGTLKLLVAPDADSRWILSQTHNIFTQVGVRQLYVQIDVAAM
ncbi:hypothetical protein cypCar_00037595 [Cyprinus carpio]|nr:hypothetical protein cypCar_00037595 [Cyprinus carpio]